MAVQAQAGYVKYVCYLSQGAFANRYGLASADVLFVSVNGHSFEHSCERALDAESPILLSIRSCLDN